MHFNIFVNFSVFFFLWRIPVRCMWSMWMHSKHSSLHPYLSTCMSCVYQFHLLQNIWLCWYNNDSSVLFSFQREMSRNPPDVWPRSHDSLLSIIHIQLPADMELGGVGGHFLNLVWVSWDWISFLSNVPVAITNSLWFQVRWKSKWRVRGRNQIPLFSFVFNFPQLSSSERLTEIAGNF